MSEGDLLYLSALELRDLVARRDVTAKEIVRRCLVRIEQLTPKLGAVVALRADAAIDEARQMDAGEPDGALAGIPVLIKDFNETRDLPTTFGSHALADARLGTVIAREATAPADRIDPTPGSSFNAYRSPAAAAAALDVTSSLVKMRATVCATVRSLSCRRSEIE